MCLYYYYYYYFPFGLEIIRIKLWQTKAKLWKITKPVDRKLNHLLDRIEVGIVEIAQEPEETGPENLAKQENERGKVEHVDHADEPVEKHGRAGRLLERRETIDESGVEEAQRAYVEPDAAYQREHAYFENDQ